EPPATAHSPAALHDALPISDDSYRVVIRTSDSFGTLKVGEVVIPGSSDETFVICAHLCHPHMVNDDLSGVVVGIDVARALLQRTDRKSTRLNSSHVKISYAA